MNENKRPILSLILLALFICLVGLAYAALAGGSKGGNDNEKNLENYFYYQSLAKKGPNS
jgi:hypothetical protein